MTLSDFSLSRPVGAIVLNILIIIFGIVGYTFLGVRLYPTINPHTINVRTSYTGANAEIIESQITEPLEKAINGIESIRTISSVSSLGNSNITVEFQLGSDMEKSANDVRDKVSQAIRALPQDIDAPPIVSKADANSDPIIFMPVISSKMTVTELSDYAENVLQEKLQTIPGVSAVNIFGQKRPSMRLWIDPARLAANNLTVQDIFNALNRENVDLPGGKVRGNETELTIKTFGRLASDDDFNNLIIKQTDNRIVRFSDVGEAIIGPENEETSIKMNGITGVSLSIVPQPGANYIDIANEFYRRLVDIKKNLPEGMAIDISIDKTKFVKKSILEVQETLLIAILLVVLIVYLFFRNWIIAVRPLIDIPVSLIATFFIMYIFGFSINILTMLAVILATGLVVDDGIVVTENIFKKIESGMDKHTAAREGTKEIYFAVISTSITLAIVFLPIVFLQGFTGRLFREFGIVVAGAVLVSAFVSLSLTPVLNVMLSKKSHHQSKFYTMTEPFFQGMENYYNKSLRFFTNNRWLVVVIILTCFGFIYLFSTLLKTELAPLEDKSMIRNPLTAPEGTDFDKTLELIDSYSKVLMDSIPEARIIYGITAPSFSNSFGVTNTGVVSVVLKDPEDRVQTQQQIYDRITKILKKMPAARVLSIQEQTISTSMASGSQLPVQFVLQNLDFSKIEKALPVFLDEARKDPTFGNVDVNLKFNKPELQVRINRLKATDLGVSVLDISNTLQLAISGKRFGYFLQNGKQYQVIGQVDRKNRDKPLDLTSLYVRSNKSEMIQLSNLVELVEASNPPSLYHYNRFKAATIAASLAPGKTLGEGIEAMQKIADRILDDSFRTDLSGPSRDFVESGSNTSFALILALILIYLVLAFQFESFRDPFIIMMTVPLAIAGAMLSLWLFGQTINIFSEIGMIMLIGLVTKNGILIVEFANQKQLAGLDKINSSVEAATSRLRPILMTSLATVLGALPIALALGAGAKSRMPMGIVIVGGMLFALVLTLYVVPVFYIFLAKKKHPKTV
jgi:hydrophobe/amphiphile efflux-1 (HAE1) family protein